VPRVVSATSHLQGKKLLTCHISTADEDFATMHAEP
jgi:hypothetical protein